MQFFSSDQVKASLAQLGIPFEANAIAFEKLAFKSLRTIEPAGIFFVEGPASPPIADSLVICSTFEGFHESNALVRVAHPQLAYYKLMRLLFPLRRDAASIHPTAIVDEAAQIEPEVEIGPYCVVGKSELRRGVRLASHVVIMDGCVVGENTVIESQSTIGASGVAWVWDPETGERVVQPQIGGVRIGRNCFLGSDISVVRGSISEDTVIGDGTVVAHGTKIGHGCTVGPLNHFANNVSLAGNVVTGQRCFFGSGSVVRPMAQLCDDTTVGAGAVVVNNVTEAGLVLMGVPAQAVKSAKTKLSGVPKRHTSGETA
jgi:UDP-3-O-[3-hydroxymyristoyl] glucosamine N-acyltransferase